MQKASRRDVLTRGGAIAAVAATWAMGFGAKAQARGSLETQVRSFAQNLLSDPHKLTSGEWVERKRIANVLKVLIGDAYEPWEDWELEIAWEIERARVRLGWEAQS